MPFVNEGITVKTVEQLQYCLDHLEKLNSLIQTDNGLKIPVTITLLLVSDGISVHIKHPTTGVRVCPNATKDFWIDYNIDQREVSIRVSPNLLYIIHFPNHQA